MTEKKLTEQYINQVTESIQGLFDLTARIDERLKMIAEKQSEQDAKIEKYVDTHTKLVERVVSLESKNGRTMKANIERLEKDVDLLERNVHSMELSLNSMKIYTINQESRWKMIFDVAAKILIIVVGAIIVWQLGIR